MIDNLSPPELLSQLPAISNGKKPDEDFIKPNIVSELEYQTSKSRSPVNSDMKKIEVTRHDRSRSNEKKRQECIELYNTSLS